MNTRMAIVLCVMLTPTLALGDEELSAFLYCDNADATALWGEGDPTDIWYPAQTRWAKIEYRMRKHDGNSLVGYKYRVEFSGGATEMQSAHTTMYSDDDFTGNLFQKFDTGGDRYWKDIDLTIYAEVKNASNNSLIDWEDDDCTFRYHDDSWVAKTETDISQPKSSKWRFDDIYVVGFVQAQQEDGSGMDWVLKDRWVDIKLENGPDITQNVADLTGGEDQADGQFQCTFSPPTAGWDPDYDYTVTATFRANQWGPHRPYATSSDTEQHAITRTIEPDKSTWQLNQNIAGNLTFDNPTDDTTWDSSGSVYDLDGTLRGIWAITAPPPHGTTVVNEDAIDDLLSTTTGTTVIDRMLAGYETWASPPGRDTAAAPGYAQPGPQAWVETLAFQPPLGKGPWGHSGAWGYDPPTKSAALTMRFYAPSGTLLHTEHATVAAYARFEVPPSWLIGVAAMHAEISDGLLAGWTRAQDGTYDAFETIAHTTTATELCAPYMSAAAGWQTVMILHNPGDGPVSLLMRWYDMSGALLAAVPYTVPHKATMTFDTNYVGPPGVNKSVEIEVMMGPGLVGSCVRTTAEGTTMAESLVTGETALRVPSNGSPMLQEGLLCLHNPEETPVTANVLMYRVDGTPEGGGPMTIPAHATYQMPVLSPQPGVEPIPSVEIRAGGGGRVAAIMMLHQMESGGTASVEALLMPDIARCEPPWLQEGWNLVSIPLDPFNPAAEAVLAALQAAGNDLTNAVHAYRGTGYAAYPTDLTEMARGEGYWLKLTNPVPFSIFGDAARDDVNIGLGVDWSLIGCPTTGGQDWASCSITDGTETKTVAEAISAGWIQPGLWYYEPAVGYRLVKHDGTGDDNQLRPFYGYWLRAYRAGLALVVPIGAVSGGADAGAGQGKGISQVKIHLTASAARDWDFTAGLDATASDSVDPLDLGAPPAPPGDLAEVRFTSTVPLYGAQRDDWRTPECQGVEVWPASVSAINFAPAQCEQVTLTWDVSGTGDYAYQLVDLAAEQTINLTPGGNHQFQVCQGEVRSFELRASETGRLPCDYDCDGDVDTDDWTLFEGCATAPGVAYDPDRLPESCTLPPDPQGILPADLDEDGDVDHEDFGQFQQALTKLAT